MKENKLLAIIIPIGVIFFIGGIILMNRHVENLYEEYPFISKTAELKTSVKDVKEWHSINQILDNSGRKYSISATSISNNPRPLSYYLEIGDSLFRKNGNDTLKIIKNKKGEIILLEIGIYKEEMK